MSNSWFVGFFDENGYSKMDSFTTTIIDGRLNKFNAIEVAKKAAKRNGTCDYPNGVKFITLCHGPDWWYAYDKVMENSKIESERYYL